MLHPGPDVEQASLLQPTVQHFVALMPIDSDATLSTGSACGNPRSDPGSGTDADVDVLFMQDSDRQYSCTAYTDHEPQIITSLTAPPQIIYHNTSTSTVQHP